MDLLAARLSMRTPGAKVAGGRSGRSLSVGGLSRSSLASGVAVLVCCTASRPGRKGHATWASAFQKALQVRASPSQSGWPCHTA